MERWEASSYPREIGSHLRVWIWEVRWSHPHVRSQQTVYWGYKGEKLVVEIHIRRLFPWCQWRMEVTWAQPTAGGMEKKRQTCERQGREQQLDFVIRGEVEREKEVVTETLHGWWSLVPLTKTGTLKGWADLEERRRVQCVTVTHVNWAAIGPPLTAS